MVNGLVKIKSAKGFTLVELLVVLAVISLLITLASPRYFRSLDKAKETALKHDLSIIRESIGQFYNDQNRYPRNLEELVQSGYLKAIPKDPITEDINSWVFISPIENSSQPGIFDIHSGAQGKGSDGVPYAYY